MTTDPSAAVAAAGVDPDPAAMLQELWDRDRISRLPLRYAHGVDRRDWDLVRSCFTADAQVEGSRATAAVGEYLDGLIPGVEYYPTTMHFMGNQLVTVDGNRGQIETYAVAFHWKGERAGADHPANLVVGVRYHDTVVRTDAGWLISFRHVDPDWRSGEYRPRVDPVAAYEIDGVVPVVDPSAYVHPEAVLIGDVIIGPGCYVGPTASLRGDFGSVVLEVGSNVQDGCVLHCFPGRQVVVEEDGHIGHGAVLHGCRIGRGALVGMNSVVMDGAVIGAYAFVGACSFVKAEVQVPDRHLAVGNPATVTRELSEAEMAWKANGTRVYQELARRSLATLRPVVPLTEVGADRVRLSTDASVAVPLRSYRRS